MYLTESWGIQRQTLMLPTVAILHPNVLHLYVLNGVHIWFPYDPLMITLQLLQLQDIARLGHHHRVNLTILS